MGASIGQYSSAIKRRIKSLTKKGLASEWFLIPYFNKEQRGKILQKGDPVRYGALYLAMEQIEKDKVEGAIAECGVYKGHLSRFIHGELPNRPFYLFDTFAGFDERDLKQGADNRFSDTSVETVLNYIGNRDGLIVKQGFFPETADGVEDTFSLIVLDFDKYDPTLAGLEKFYPLLSAGGFIFVHDYSSPESDWACSRAVNEFFADKPESPVLIPDKWGSAIIRKV